MRPAYLVTFAGFAMASTFWAARTNASACTVDTDCLDNGLACGTDVCSKTGTCVPAGSDPGTCNSQGNCKCYGLLSVLCNPQTHSCTMTSADGGLNSGGGATSGGGGTSSGTYGGMGASGTMGSGGSGTTSDMDAGSSQAASGSAAGTSGSAVGTSGSTVDVSGTVTGGPGTGTSGSSGVSGPTVAGSGNAASGNAGGSGASAGSSESSAKASKSGCSVGFGDTQMPAGVFGIVVGAWALSGRRRGRRGSDALLAEPVGDEVPEE